MSRSTLKALFILLLCTVVYHWKILLTNHYSVLEDYEGLGSNLAWLQYWILSIRDGALPLWNPYSFGGYPFGGSMQTGAFYPLHLLLVLMPFNRAGIFSPGLFHVWFALVHFLGACLMYALAREFGLRRFPSVIAGICFSAGGFVGRAGWAFFVHTAIWLPLIVLFLLRALRAERMKTAALYASLSGLGLGLGILAGGLHISIMQALVVSSAVAFAALHPQLRKAGPLGRALIRPAIVLAIVAGVGFCAGAVQLFTAAEYSNHAVRFFGAGLPLPPGERIPYNYPNDNLWPHGYWGLLILTGFGGQMGGGEVVSFYMGVFTLLAAVIGVWKRWGTPWVRYLAGLAVVTFLYTLGDFSPVYGLLHTLVPYLWMAREASRFMYLVEFAMALLAAFGVEALLHEPVNESAWRPLTRVLTWIAIGCVVAQAIPAVFERPGINAWIELSLLLILASYGLYRYVIGGHSGAGVRFAMVALIVFDLTAFNWTGVDRDAAKKAGSDALDSVLSTRGAVKFLKSRPGRFRVQFAGINEAPPIGDLFQVSVLSGAVTPTLLNDYLVLLWNGHMDLLAPRYTVKPASASEPGDIYHDSKWKVYENPTAYPAAWLVHDAIVEPSPERLVKRLSSPEVDLHRKAVLTGRLESALEPLGEGASENVTFGACGRNRLELTVRAQSRGLLVVSEIFYPGWRAAVNGKTTRIVEVDGALRGVVVPRGESRIVMQYSPWSFWLGAFLTVAAFAGTLLAVFLAWRNSRRTDPRSDLPVEPAPAT